MHLPSKNLTAALTQPTTTNNNNSSQNRKPALFMRWLFALLMMVTVGANAQISVTGGTGLLPTYTSFTNAGGLFAAINLTAQTGNNIVVTVTGDITNEAGTTSLNAGAWTTINITPVGTRIVSGAAAAGVPMINLNGADNVTINGLNTGGNSLTISNTTVSATSLTSTIRLIGGATGNTITNCSILGSANMAVGTNGGNIMIHTDANTANGNDNNTISNNLIGAAGANFPSKGIYGSGSTTTTAIGNSGNIITNNNFENIFGAAVASAGLYINDGCNTWTITNNRFYQTATRTWTTGATLAAININSSTAVQGAQAFTITGNIIGYASNTQTGVYTLTGAGSAAKFFGIRFNGITGGTVSDISSNTIAAVSMTGVTSSGTTSSSPFQAIFIENGLANSNSNTVGSQSATGSLVFSTTTTSATDVYGLHNFSVDNWTTNSNNIGGISVTNLGASGTFLLYATRANTSTAKTWTAASNLIGGTIANSIQLTATGVSSQVVGMFTSNAGATFTSNTIRNLTTNIGTGATSSASVIGINLTSTSLSNTANQNTIFNLSNTNATAASVVTGIQFTGNATGNVLRNNIYGLSVSSTSASAEINGIRVAGGTTTYANNMIALGTGVTNAVQINGINEPSATGTDNFYHNSVYIGGSPTAGIANSFAFNSLVTTNTRNFRDNIFMNARSNSGATGKNYAVQVGGTAANPAGLTINYNVYYVSGSGGVFGRFNALDVADLTAWKIAVGQDANSAFGNPQYLDPTNATPDLHINPAIATPVEAAGIAIAAVTDDFDGQTRSTLTPTDMGADAGNFTALAGCTGIPADAAISGATAICSGTGTTLSLSTTYSDPGITYQWKSSAVPGGPYVNMGTGATQATGNLAATRYYQATITCTNSGQSFTTPEYTLTVNPAQAVSATATPTAVCPGSTTVLNAVSESYTITGTLQGSQEVPPTGSPAIGTVRGVYNAVTNVLTMNVEFSGLSGTVTDAHIHGPAAVGVNAGVIVGLTGAFGVPTGVTAGSATGTVTIPALNESDLLNGLTYVNIHTTAFGGGEIRAQLTATVNNPASYAWTPTPTLDNPSIQSPTATPVANTTYTVIVTGTGGCTATANVAVTMATAPQNVVATATPSSICSGAQSTLNVTASIPFTAKQYNFSYTPAGANLDPMSGATTVVGSGVDDAPMALSGSTAGASKPIGFTVSYEGALYTHFAASPDGWLQFRNNTTAAVDQFTNATTSSTNIPKIYPYWDDQATGTTGSVQTLVTGSAPNRIFKVQWFTTIPRAVSGAANSTYQAWIYEGSGLIQFHYGTMGTNTSGSISGGLTGATSTNFHSLTFNTNTSSNTTANDLNATAPQTPASGTLYSYASPIAFTYAWSPAGDVVNPTGQSTLTNPLTATQTFTVTVTNAGCSTTAQTTVTVSAGAAIVTDPSPTAKCVGQTATFTVVASGPSLTYQWRKDGIDIPIGSNASAGTATLSLPNVTAADAGTYDVVVTASCGSPVTSAGALLTVNALPTIIVTPSTGLICNPGGTAVSLTASGASTYTWSPTTGLTPTTGATVSANPTATTTYTATGTDANGCVGTGTATITVSTKPVITSVTASPTSVCSGGSTTLTAAAGATVYTMASTTFGLLTADGTPTSAGTGDDALLATIALPFPITFFGTPYSTGYLYSNGFMSFTTGQPTGSPYTATIPSAATPNNFVAISHDDLNVTVSGQVTYFTNGTAPNRIFVLNYAGVKYYNSAANNGDVTGQVQFFESNGRIEIHLSNSSDPVLSAKSLGIENAAGTVGYSPAGRNNASYNVTTPEAWSFTPLALSYLWSETPNNGTLTSTTTNPTTATNITVAETYSVTVTDAVGCTATLSAAPVTINPNANAGTVSGTTPLCSDQTATYTSTGDAGGTWSSTVPGVASVNPTTGLVTAISAGSTDITYTVSTGCNAPVSAFQTLVVSANANAGTVSGTTPLCSGQTATYTSTGDAGGTWSSTVPGVASVNPTTGLVTAISAGSTDITYTVSTGCNAPVSSFQTLVVSANANAGTVSGTTPLCSGQTATYTSTGDAGGTWSSTSPGVASVNPTTGLVTAISAGSTDITYTVSTGCNAPVSAFQTLVVDANANAGTVTGTTPLCSGQTATYTSTGDAGGTWSSTSPGVASVNPTTGLVTAISAGSTDITYTVSTGCNAPVSAFQTLVVDANANAGTVTGTTPLCSGQTATYTSTGDAGGTWSSTVPGVASVDPNTGLVTAISAGSTDITYTVSTGCNAPVSAFQTLVVSANANAGTVSGTTPLCSGQTATYTSTGDAGGTWSSTVPGVASVNPTTGLVTAISAGSTDITYTVSTGCNAPVSAFQTLVVDANANAGTVSGTTPLCSGQTANYTSTGDAGGTWSSTVPGVASVNPTTGLVTAISAGTTDITYTVSTGCNAPVSAFQTLVVSANANAGTVTGTTPLCSGQTATYTSTGDAGGTWSSTVPGVASVNPTTGLVTAISAGSTDITYTVSTGCNAPVSAFQTLVVSPNANAGTVSGTTPLNVGATATYTSTGDAGGTWSSTVPGVASVNPTTGLVTALSAGSTDITYTVSTGCNAPVSAFQTLVVNANNNAGTVTGPTPLCIGATGTYTSDGTPGGTWSSTNTSVATVDPNTGVVTAVSAGTTNITYTVPGPSSSFQTLTVSPNANAGTVSGATPLCLGNTAQYSTTGDAGGTWSSTNPGVASVNATGFVTALNAGTSNITYTVSGCNGPVSSFQALTVNAAATTPGPLTGPINVCPYVGSGQQITYSVPQQSGATYQWVIPPTNVTLVSGQGTNSIVVTFQNGFSTQGNKQIRVTALSPCGNSPQAVFILAAQLAATPGPITASSNNVCAVIGTAGTITYTIRKVESASSYNWVAQAGTTAITHPNGLGPNDTTVNVSFTNGFTTSNITVQAVNSCGASGIRSLTIARNNPAVGAITGPTNACPHILPNGTPATYSVTPVSTATSYNWTAPAGSIITHPNGTGANDYTITVLFPNGFTNGSITVQAVNGCGSSAVRSLAIGRLLPAAPAPIDVINTAPCPNRVYTYSLSGMPANATSIQWTVPAGGTLVSGQGTISITVSYVGTAISGNVTAQAVNNCGVSGIRSLSVKLPSCPPSFTGGGNTNGDGQMKGSMLPVGIDAMSVSVFPNPSVSDFKLQVITAGKEVINVRILDLQGREFKRITVMPHQTISIGSELKAGAYMIEVRQGKELKTTRVLKF